MPFLPRGLQGTPQILNGLYPYVDTIPPLGSTCPDLCLCTRFPAHTDANNVGARKRRGFQFRFEAKGFPQLSSIFLLGSNDDIFLVCGWPPFFQGLIPHSCF